MPDRVYPELERPEQYIPPQPLNAPATPRMAETYIELSLLQDLRYGLPLLGRLGALPPIENPGLVRQRIVEDLSERLVKGSIAMGNFALTMGEYSLGALLSGGLIGSLVLGTGINLLREGITDKLGITSFGEFLDERSFIRGISKEFISGPYSKDISMAGFTPKEAGNITRWLKKFYEEEGKDFEEINKELTAFVGTGLIRNVRGLEDFKRQFKELKESVKKIVETFKTTEDEAIQLLSDMEQKGISISKAPQILEQTNRLAMLSGRDRGQILQFGLATAEAYQGTGLSALAGTRVGELMYATSTMAIKQGFISPNTAWNLGGAEGIAQRMAKLNVAAFNDPYLDLALRAAMTPQGGINEDVIFQTLAGERTAFQNFGTAVQNMYNQNGFLTYLGAKTNMVNQLIEKYPGLGAAFILRNILSGAGMVGIDVNNIGPGDYAKLAGYAQMRGIDQQTFESLLGQVRALYSTLQQMPRELQLARRNRIEEEMQQKLSSLKETLSDWGFGSKKEAALSVLSVGVWPILKRTGIAIGELTQPWFSEGYQDITRLGEGFVTSIEEEINKRIYGEIELEFSEDAAKLLQTIGPATKEETALPTFTTSILGGENTILQQIRERIEAGQVEAYTPMEFIEKFVPKEDIERKFVFRALAAGKTYESLQVDWREKIQEYDIGSGWVYDEETGKIINVAKELQLQQQIEAGIAKAGEIRTLEDVQKFAYKKLRQENIETLPIETMENRVVRLREMVEEHRDEWKKFDTRQKFDFVLNKLHLRDQYANLDEEEQRIVSARISLLIHRATGELITPSQVKRRDWGELTLDRLEELKERRKRAGEFVWKTIDEALGGKYIPALGFLGSIGGAKAETKEAILDQGGDIVLMTQASRYRQLVEQYQKGKISHEELMVSISKLKTETIEKLKAKGADVTEAAEIAKALPKLAYSEGFEEQQEVMRQYFTSVAGETTQQYLASLAEAKGLDRLAKQFASASGVEIINLARLYHKELGFKTEEDAEKQLYSIRGGVATTTGVTMEKPAEQAIINQKMLDTLTGLTLLVNKLLQQNGLPHN